MADFNKKLIIGLAAVAIVLGLASRRNRDDFKTTATSYADEDNGHRASSSSSSLATKNLFELELERESLRRSELNPLVDEVVRAQQRAAALRSSMGWFPSADQKASLEAAESMAKDANNRLAVVQRKEQALVRQIKPMLGVVSAEFFSEARTNVGQSFKTVSSIAYNQAWWESIFNLGRAESISDVLVDFVAKYAMIFLILYPFVAIYLIAWSLPWQISEYCADVYDVPTAIAMWLACTVIVSLPAVGLYFGAKLAIKYGNARQRAQAERLFR